MYSDGFITRGVDSDSQQQQNETPERRSASAGAVEHARHERDLSGHYMGIEFASQQPVFEAPPNTAQERAVDSQLLARAAAPQGPFARGDFNSMEQPSLFMASSASAPPAFKSVAAMPGHSAPLDFSRPDLLMAKPSLGATSTMMQQQTKQFEIVTPAAPVAQIAQQMQSAASPPPQAPDFYEKSSSFQSEAEPAEILTSIYSALQSTQMVNGCEVDTEGWSISGWAQLHHQCASFCVFLYTLVTGKTLVEFQRRKGDTMTFVDLFQATVLRADAIRPKPIDAMHPLPVNAAAQAMREQAAARMSPSNQFGMGMPTLGGATSRVPLSRATSSPFEETVSIEGPLTETLIDMSLSDVFEPQREAIAAMARASEDASNSLALAQDKRILAALQAALQPSAFEIVAPAMVCLSNLCCSTMVGQDICQQLVENQDLTQRLFELLSTSVKSQRAIAASAARIALQLSQYQKDALKDFQQVMSNVADTTDDAAIRHDTSQALRNVLAH
eukprot:GABV01008564.1.p1 GENE.GABV01008564.1~~GABV01008564.1.p1  ORF type:complete len:502 (-),score=172.14 GABV01008564.1:39-1544(-)